MSNKSYIARFGKLLGERDGWTCHYCQKQLVPHGTPESDDTYYRTFEITRWSETIGSVRVPREGYVYATVDHIEPRVRGGGDELSNLVLCCHLCNSTRRDTPYDEFVKGLAS